MTNSEEELVKACREAVVEVARTNKIIYTWNVALVLIIITMLVVRR